MTKFAYTLTEVDSIKGGYRREMRASIFYIWQKGLNAWKHLGLFRRFFL